MGQTIITSHSPYVIEQFEPEQIVMVKRAARGGLSGKPVDIQGIKPKTFKTERRQFAEAVLSRAVLVVEGGTEAAMFPEASAVLEQARGSENYTHFDLAGVTVFNAGGDASVPRYGPVFKALAKEGFGFYDKPAAPLTADAQAKLAHYTQVWESPYRGIENLLVEEMRAQTLRQFLDTVKDRADYPINHPKPVAGMNDADIKELARKVLKDRKGEAFGYGALLIAACKAEDELPATMRTILEEIHQRLAPPPKGNGAAVQPEQVEGAVAGAAATAADEGT